MNAAARSIARWLAAPLSVDELATLADISQRLRAGLEQAGAGVPTG